MSTLARANTTVTHEADLRGLVMATSDAFATSTDLRSALRSITTIAVQKGMADWCIIDILDPSGNPHRLAASHVNAELQRDVDELRRRGPPSPAERDLLWQVLLTGQARLVPNVTDALRHGDTEHAKLLRRLGFGSLLVVPLTDAVCVRGAITLVRAPSRPPLADDDLKLATAWARLCGAALDWLARYRAERQARVSAEELARARTAALEHIADAVVTADGHGRIDFINSAARALFGFADDDRPNALPLLAPDGHKLDDGSDPLSLARSSHELVGTTELFVRRPNGDEAVVEVFAAPLDDRQEREAGAVLTMHDVTAWRERERTRDETFADVSHDLRTPVAAISGAIEVFLRDAPPGIPAPLYHMLLIIEQESARMRALVDDVLELTMVDAGRVRLYRTLVDLRAIARHVARAIEPVAAGRKQHVVAKVPRYAMRAKVDVLRLERGLINLVSNAQRYAPPGGSVRVHLERRGDEAVFAVSDDGPGIPADEHQRIFERFYRSGGHRGSGLGLPIAKAMVELHGGRIWLHSAPGQGSTFYIAIPVSR
jgi:PAS domain S-box-containing protein